VLILTAGFGEGHNAAARNLREGLLAADPGANVVISDVFLEAGGSFNRFIQKGYIWVINHLPLLWRVVFALMHRWPALDQLPSLLGVGAKQRLRKLIAEHRPDVVVSTFPGCNHLLDSLYLHRLKRPFKTITIVTDSLTINAVWYRGYSDYFLLPNDATATILMKAGVPLSRLRVSGFPVPSVFATMKVDRLVPPSDGRWKVLYIVNSAFQTAPDVVRGLLGVSDIALTVTVGRNQELGDELARLAEDMGRPLSIYGWTPEIPRLMAEHHVAISKAGGATVQELLAAGTPLIITQIVPGQEEGNARLILQNHAGALATTPEAIAEKTRQVFADDAALWRQWVKGVKHLAQPNATARIARFILDQNE